MPTDPTVGMPREFAKIAKACRKAGTHTVEKTTNHVRWTNVATGETVITSSTFYDGPLTRKYRTMLRKIGCPGA